MNYEDIEEARAKGAAKDAAKAKGKGKRGQKRQRQMHYSQRPRTSEYPSGVDERRTRCPPVARMD
jgi:hypothetical protein